MIATTLLANGAKVYIIGLEQTQVNSVVAIYDNAVGGRLVGLVGDISKKARHTPNCKLLPLTILLFHRARRSDWPQRFPRRKVTSMYSSTTPVS